MLGPLWLPPGSVRAFLAMCVVFVTCWLSIEEAEELRRHVRSGRPLGSEVFVARLKRLLGRILCRQKPGPKGPRRRGKRASAKNQAWCSPKDRGELKRKHDD